MGDVANPSGELQQSIARYDPTALDGASPSPILTDAPTGAQDASRRLREQLHAYLGRLRAAGVAMPTADLVYAQSAAHADGLEDPGLARVLDIAADTTPDLVVEAFQDASEADRRAAVRFLIAQLGRNFGALRTNLIEAAARIAFLLDADSAREIAPIAWPSIIREVTTGRWRPPMTIGAIWLGLLDPKGGDPIAALAPTGDVEYMAASGGMDALVARMADFADRADLLFPCLGEAFGDHPSAFTKSLRTLPPAIATRLWLSEEHKILDWLQTTSAQPKTAQTPIPTGEVVDSNERASQRLGLMLDAVCSREGSELSLVTTRLVQLGLATATKSARQVILERRDAIFEALAPEARNACALDVIASATNVDEIDSWAKMLDPSVDAPEVAAAAACETCVSLLAADAGSSSASILVHAISRVAAWLSNDSADAVAASVLNALVEEPPDGTPANASLRSSLRTVLSALTGSAPDSDYVDTQFYSAVVAAVRTGKITDVGCTQLLSEIRHLTPTTAERLDAVLASAKPSSGNDPAALLRARITAGAVAGLAPLKATDVVSVLPAGDVVSEWIETNPRMAEFLRFVQAGDPSESDLSTYSEKRNVRERSRLWIELERAGRGEDLLRAVGAHGVDKSVVSHMAGRIRDASLLAQTAETRRLVTADLGFSSDVRSVANDLTIALLATKIAGAGTNAAKIAIASRGAAPGRTSELRQAFDGFTKAVSRNQIPKGELRALDELKLISHRKKSPIAAVLGWFAQSH